MKHSLLIVFFLPFIALAQNKQNIESTLETVNVETGNRTIIYSDTVHFEAPNWSKDGTYFIVNKSGKLYKVNRSTAAWSEIPFHPNLRANNDHGISPDGKLLAISSEMIEPGSTKQGYTSYIYTGSIEGGPLKKITDQSLSYWHGWSPDGQTLAFVGKRNEEFDIYTISVNGGEEKRLTTEKGLDDGPDYSPDGKYIYYNSFRSGSMQIWRMDANGGNPLQLTDDHFSNWFPHPSPDGKHLVILTFLQDQGQDHPFGKDVKLRLLNLASGTIKDLTKVFFGGQGSINVPSWSPDSKEIAFISYKIRE